MLSLHVWQMLRGGKETSLNSLFLFLLIQTPTANAQPNNTVQVTRNQVIFFIPCIKFVL